MAELKRYWVSWWSGNYAEEGCTKPPFQFWCSGYRDREGEGDEESLCAVIDAPDEDLVFTAIEKHYPDCKPRFCEEKAPDFEPDPERFPDFRYQTDIGHGRLLMKAWLMGTPADRQRREKEGG
jgi:hypothetical protein